MKKIILLLLISSCTFGQRNLDTLFRLKDSGGRGLSKNDLTDTRKDGIDLNVLGAGKNLYNPANAIEGFFVVTSNGTMGITAGYAGSGYIPVSASTQYTLSGMNIAASSFAMRFENSSHTLLSFFSQANNGSFTFPLTFTTPANCAYIIFTIRHSSSTLSLAEAARTVQLERASSATTFQKFFPAMDAGYVKNEVLTKSRSGKNLFNPATGTDGFFLENTNVAFSSSTYGYSDYIEVTPGQVYIGTDGVNGMRKVCYYDQYYNVVAGGSTDPVNSFVPPSGVKYARVTYTNARKYSFQLEQSPVATVYEPFAGSVVKIGNQSISDVYRRIGIRDVERIMTFGDSYSEGYNTLPGKNWLSVLSMFTDWNVENYSKSGDNYAEILARIQANNATYTNWKIKDFTGGGYGLLISFTNDNGDGIINSTDQLNVYAANVRKLMSAVKGLGYKPIIATEYHNNAGANGALLMQSVLSDIANREGAIFADMYEKTRFLRGTDYSFYWDGSHPNVRSNGLFWQNILPYINALPRPKWGVKVYRKRDITSVSTVADLMVNSVEERARKFREIYVSQRAISSVNYKYYDDMPGFLSAGQGSQLLTEYADLTTGVGATMNDYTLLEFVVNATAANTRNLTFFVGSTTATVYVKDVSTQTWVALTNRGGYVTLTDLQTQMDYDKVSLLVYVSGGYTLRNPTVDFVGVEGKDYYVKPLPRDFRTAELLTTQLITTTTGWATTGTVTPADASDSNYPTGVTKVATLGSGNAVTQTVTFTAADYKRKAQVKLIARVNPSRYSSAGTFPTGAAITLDTFDPANIQLQVIKSTSTATFENVVGLHWHEVVFEFDVNAGDTSFDIKILRGSYAKDIEFCKASVKIE